jgi:Sporulation and spore germination
VSRRAATLLVAVCAIVLLGAFWLWRRPAPELEPTVGEAEIVLATEATPGETWTARLWFPADDGRLGAEEREIESAPEARERVTAAIAALLASAPEPPLAPVFPWAVEVHKVLIGAGGVVFLDLRSPDGVEPPGSGSNAELQRVYALVHTALDASPEVSSVVLLWNGVQRRSLSGHVDTARPLRRFAPMEPR